MSNPEDHSDKVETGLNAKNLPTTEGLAASLCFRHDWRGDVRWPGAAGRKDNR